MRSINKILNPGPHCKRCGSSLVWKNNMLCARCLKEYSEIKKRLLKSAEEKHGTLSSDNIEKIKKEVNKNERI